MSGLKQKIPEIKKEWENSDFKTPEGLLGIDGMKRIFITARDDQPIITFVFTVTAKTFMIPKKYCELDKGIWIIKNPSKMSFVSCSRSTLGDYDEFAIEILKKLRK